MGEKGTGIGQGKPLKEALAEMTMVAEGVRTSRSTYDLTQQHKLDLPIVTELYRCLHEGKGARESLHDLLTRPVHTEMGEIEHLIK